MGVPIKHLKPVTVSTASATSRPHNAQLQTTALEKLGIDITHVPFNTWWEEEFLKPGSTISSSSSS